MHIDCEGAVDVADMKLYTGFARMIGEEEVAVELDVLGARNLDGGICLVGKGQGWHWDAGQ